ncbi:putative deoxyribonuclease RhsB [Aquisphaera giovannonii]|uniref:Putative deoxyribonuclease RhsB n=1 Tax=Aquisphaera giovannonii TaxID=406548 RepID=A0A5B9VZC0_9BACT|nr:RHS repeat-associated core domain-containing protein [Aquisphaera giovannonii]QEH33321.1 putative deoxyribonuclease RhsB [Aquisphaera giovannonii]
MCVNVATGVVTLSAREFHLSGEMPFALLRSYSSASGRLGPLGWGWSSDLELWARLEGDTAILFEAGEETSRHGPLERDRELWFHRETLGAMRVLLTAETLIVTTAGRRRLVFAAPPRPDDPWLLRRISDLNGNAASFDHDEDGHLVRATDGRGRRFALSYERGLLTRVELRTADRDPMILARYEYDARQDLVSAWDASGARYEYEYADHLVVRETNPSGGSRYYAYDRDRRAVATWLDGDVRYRGLVHDPARRTTLLVDSRGWGTLHRFNEADLCREKVDALGQVKRTFFAPDNSLLFSEDEELGPVSLQSYDPATRSLTTLDAAGAATVTQFNELNLPVRSEDPEGNAWVAEYDERGNQVALGSPMGRRWSHSYDARGRLERVIEPAGRVIAIRRERDGRAITYSDQLGTFAACEVDDFGRLVRYADEAGRTTTWSHDALGRLVAIRLPGGGVVRIRRDEAGRPIEALGPMGYREQRTYDRFGLLLSVTDSAGRVSRFEYDSEQRLIAATGPRGERATIDHDRLGRPHRMTYPDGRVEAFEFDAQGYVVAARDPSGVRFTLEYDAMRRLTARRYPDGRETTYTYDAAGRLIAAASPWSVVEIEYDADGRAVKEAQAAGTLSHGFDGEGRRRELHFDEARIAAYYYDPRGRLAELTDAAGRAIRIRHEDRGATVESSDSSGVVERSEYGPTGLLQHRRAVGPRDAVLHDREYRRDEGGRVATVADLRAGTATSYRYDRAGRLQSVERDGEVVEDYAYDAGDNPVRSHDGGGYEHGHLDRLTMAGSLRCGYDANGNLAWRERDGGRTEFHRDYENLLTRVTHPDGTATEFRYDAFHRRIAAERDGKTTRYLWWGDRLVAEAGPDGVVTYAHTPGGFQPVTRARDGVSLRYITDPIGSPQALVDQDGSVLEEIAPAGFDRPAVGGRLFPGQYFDPDTGLAWNRHRDYDPALRRYTSPDPIAFFPGSNAYAYAADDPVNAIDPLGLACFRQECEDAFQRMDNAINTEHHPPAPVNPPHPGAQVPNHKGLQQRIAEFNANTGWMPLQRNPGDPAGGGSGQANTIGSHYEQYWQLQDHLRNAQNDWWANGCHPSNTSDPARAAQVEADANHLATYTPPVPPPNPEQSRLMEGIRMFRQDAGSGLWLPVH